LAICALIVGLLTVITGLLALATAKYKVCCFACPFMILSFVVFLIAIILAFFILLAPMWKKKTVDALCANKNIFTGAMKGFTLKSYNVMVYDNMVDKTMCTKSCKCADVKWKADFEKRLGKRPYVVASTKAETMASWK